MRAAGPRPGRVEPRAAEQGIELLQRLPQWLRQLQGAGRRLQTPSPPHQQRIGKDLAQLRQGMAYRRLAAVQAQGGAGDMLLCQQGMQGE